MKYLVVGHFAGNKLALVRPFGVREQQVQLGDNNLLAELMIAETGVYSANSLDWKESIW